MAMADEILLRVPLEITDGEDTNDNDQEGNPNASMEVEEESQDNGGDLSTVVKELNQTCFEYRRESTRRVICQASSQNHSQISFIS